jgi:CDP-L-myo-inositol myo-inositolphosphotransferase
MKCLIIAAGDGGRLKNLTKDKPKALIQLLGISLIERVILTAKQAGIKEFLIVVGYLGEKLKLELGNGNKYGVEINYIENNDFQKENGLSVLKAKGLINDNFILLMADHIVDPRILKDLIGYQGKKSIVLAVDRRTPISGDTKVLEENGEIIDIGKHIENSNCIDTGIFLLTSKIFSYIEDAVNENKTELAAGVAQGIKNKDVEIFDITKIDSYASKMRKDVEPWWIDIDTQEDLKKAKEIIVENASKNPSDALAAYVHKPIENKLVAFISRWPITPNQITIIVNILAYTVTGLFFLGYLLPAIILAFVVGIADGLDGKLARVKLKTSNLGTLEHSFDLLFEFSWFVALSWFLFKSTQNAIPLILCMFIIIFVTFYRHIYDQFRRTAGKSIDDSGGFERRFKRVAGRRNLFNIPILVGILLVPIYSLNVLSYSLVFILFQAGITAIVYSWSAIKHLSSLDNA